MSNKNVKILFVFTVVFEFSSDSKKTTVFHFASVLLMFLNVFRVEFEMKILCDFQNR